MTIASIHTYLWRGGGGDQELQTSEGGLGLT